MSAEKKEEERRCTLICPGMSSSQLVQRTCQKFGCLRCTWYVWYALALSSLSGRAECTRGAAFIADDFSNWLLGQIQGCVPPGPRERQRCDFLSHRKRSFLSISCQEFCSKLKLRNGLPLPTLAQPFCKVLCQIIFKRTIHLQSGLL